MELNWSTLLLEIINFLVLVWILKHFLYQPVLDIIARRRAMIEKQMAEARQLHAESDTLKEQYEHRLQDWEQQRQKALLGLHDEIEEQRVQLLDNLKTEIAREQEKNRVARERKDIQLQHEVERRALQQAATFSSRLLAEAAGPELEARLFDLLLDGLAEMPVEQINNLANKWGDSPERILVCSAYPLGADARVRLEDTLSRVTGLSVPVLYEQDKELLAGLNITIGPWLLQLNVRDELQGFTEFTHVE